MGQKVVIDKEELKSQMYSFKSINELARYFNCSRYTMSSILYDYGLYEDFLIYIKKDYQVRKTVEPCSICGSTFRSERYKGEWYCKKHHSQVYRNRLLEKTIYDRNDFEFDGDIVRIVLRNKEQEIVDYCIIDHEDYERIKDLKWYKNNHGYCVTKGIRKNIGTAIHRVILTYKSQYYCDHINNDKMDNRKSNLRIVTPQENAANMGKKNSNTSGVVGVQRYNQNKIPKWNVSITVNYRNIYLGRTTSFDEAVRLRIAGEAKYFKEYSNNYNPESNMIELTYRSLDDGQIKFISAPIEEELCV